MIPLRLYIYAGLAIAAAGALWYVRHTANERDEYKAKAAQLQADYGALRAAYDDERRRAKDATDEHERLLTKLAKDKSATPTRSVRLCSSPTGWVPAPGPAAEGVNPPGDAGHAGEAGRNLEAGPDIGHELYALADRVDEQLAQCASLIKWAENK